MFVLFRIHFTCLFVQHDFCKREKLYLFNSSTGAPNLTYGELCLSKFFILVGFGLIILQEFERYV